MKNLMRKVKNNLRNNMGMEWVTIVLIVGISVAVGAILYGIFTQFAPDFANSMLDQIKGIIKIK